MTIKKNRKEVVKAIMDLQDFITELHKAAISLSIFYRNRVSSSRYQRVITQLPDESAVEEKDIEIPVRVVSGKSPLMRQESVHHIPVLSPDAFNAARRAAYEQERIQQQMEEERGDRATEMEHALEEERVNEIRKMVASAKQRKEKELDRVLDETLDEVLNHKESASGKVESARRAEPSCEHWSLCVSVVLNPRVSVMLNLIVCVNRNPHSRLSPNLSPLTNTSPRENRHTSVTLNPLTSITPNPLMSPFRKENKRSSHAHPSASR